MRDLSSDIMGTGSAIQVYSKAADLKPLVVDLDVKGLSANTKAEDLKHISGAKHVISAVVEEDSIRNVCTGTGRIKMRLGSEEEIEQVKLQFLKAGLGIQEHTENSKKKLGITSEPKRTPVNEVDAKAVKQRSMAANNPEMFGTSNKYAVRA